MEEIKTKKSNYMMAVVIVMILGFALGLTAFLIYNSQRTDEGAVAVLKAVGVGIDTFFFCLALGFSIVGAIFKVKFLIIASMINAYFGLVLLLILCAVTWWIVLITAIAVAFIVLFSAIGVYRHNLTLVYSNEKEDHKTYEEMQKERREARDKEEEDLPEVKSFKD